MLGCRHGIVEVDVMNARLREGVIARLLNIHGLLADVARDGREVCVAAWASHGSRRLIGLHAGVVRVLMVHGDAAILLRHGSTKRRGLATDAVRCMYILV